MFQDTFRMSGTKTERYLFLFDKIILITKRRESGFMCKATLRVSLLRMFCFVFDSDMVLNSFVPSIHHSNCFSFFFFQLSNMMLAESISKEPLSFQIIRFDNQKITYTFLVSVIPPSLSYPWVSLVPQCSIMTQLRI